MRLARWSRLLRVPSLTTQMIVAAGVLAFLIVKHWPK